LKLTFNKSGENWFSGRLTEHQGRQKPQIKTKARVMATISSASLSTPTSRGSGLAKPLAELRAFWRQFVERAFNPYRPELHYMRGPGPAWRAKHLSRSN
jgi:hypothetical protein